MSTTRLLTLRTLRSNQTEPETWELHVRDKSVTVRNESGILASGEFSDLSVTQTVHKILRVVRSLGYKIVHVDGDAATLIALYVLSFEDDA